MVRENIPEDREVNWKFAGCFLYLVATKVRLRPSDRGSFGNSYADTV